ncbi:MAG: hypothetical protein QOK43_2005 [Acidimicrobiaceae bacterium]|nr:hypothetical protein [Acidimicrobiaceae bacterium]
MAMGSQPAQFEEQVRVVANGGRWLVSCHSPGAAPGGANHGVNAWCVTAAGDVVLVSGDGEHWGWPGGRPEGTETWDQTLNREIAEEVCATVRSARCLGFTRSQCLDGPEAGLVLVRSIWRAQVEMRKWRPEFEIRDRKTVSPDELDSFLWMEPGFEPLYERWLREAGLRRT